VNLFAAFIQVDPDFQKPNSSENYMEKNSPYKMFATEIGLHYWIVKGRTRNFAGFWYVQEPGWWTEIARKYCAKEKRGYNSSYGNKTSC
jgi:hypothetical protein